MVVQPFVRLEILDAVFWSPFAKTSGAGTLQYSQQSLGMFPELILLLNHRRTFSFETRCHTFEKQRTTLGCKHK